jgi:hypothetical protein
MKVHGYTSDKNLVAVDLPVDEIVSKEIDPWRLDLFDPEPISLSIGGQLLHFRRRREFAFAREVSKSEYVIGLHDGKQTLCVSGKLIGQGADDIRLDQIKDLTVEFDAQLAVYLKLYADTHTEEKFVQVGREIEEFIETCLHEKGWFSPPVLPGAVVLQGNQLNFKFGERNCLRRFQFTGEMFSDRTFPVMLAPGITAILKELEPWHPTIINAYMVRKLMARKRIKFVRIYIDAEGESALTSRYRKSQVVPSSVFKVDGCLFIIHARSKDDAPDHHYVYPQYDLHSVSCLWLTGQSVRGARVAFFDLSKRQARTVRAGHYVDNFSGAKTVWLEGFKFLEVPKECERQVSENFTRRMIRANSPGMRFLCKAAAWCDSTLDYVWTAGSLAIMDGCALFFDYSQPVIGYLRSMFSRRA